MPFSVLLDSEPLGRYFLIRSEILEAKATKNERLLKIHTNHTQTTSSGSSVASTSTAASYRSATNSTTPLNSTAETAEREREVVAPSNIVASALDHGLGLALAPQSMLPRLTLNGSVLDTSFR